MEIYQNPKHTPKERARDLLSRLTVREKIAQINCLFIFSADYEHMLDNYPDSIGEVSALLLNNMATVDEQIAFQIQAQKVIMAKSRLHIPAAFHMEGLSGGMGIGCTMFPAGVARGSSFDPELETRIGEIVGRQERALGMTRTLAPVLDVSYDPRMGRFAEPYGEDPTLVSQMGVGYLHGLQDDVNEDRHTESCAKHFLGFHHSYGGEHTGHAEITPRFLREQYAKPFQAAITAGGLHSVMPCYDSIDNQPVHVSHDLLTGLLREEMGFDGVTLSDYSGLANAYEYQKIGDSQAETGLLGLQAGMDVEYPNTACYNDELAKMFEDGTADIEVLDRAVERALESKFRMGLFEQPFAMQGDEFKKHYYCGTDHAVALQSAEEGIVLVKNDGILPLGTGADDHQNTLVSGDGKVSNIHTIAVIGPHVKNRRVFYGGYTHVSMTESTVTARQTMAGVGNGHNDTVDYHLIPGTKVQADDDPVFDQALEMVYPEAESLLTALQKQFPGIDFKYAEGYPFAGSDESHYQEALNVIRDTDLVILTLGGRYGTGTIATMGEGIDGTDINLPPCQEKFIRLVAREGRPMIGIHIDGRPISSDAADECLNAILETWTLSEGGPEAISEAVAGAINPSGKMPVSTAYSAGQLPVSYNHPNGSMWHQSYSIGFPDYVDCPRRPRYAFGHGLSYTTFDYSDLELSSDTINPDDSIQISCEVENTGNRKGTEVVQLYLADPHASMTRPCMELAGFQRVTLGAGGKARLIFTLDPTQIAFLDHDMKWKIEKGELQVLIGSASDDIRLEGSFCITENAYVDCRTRKFWAKSKIIDL